ncbi:hypothetical protein L2E82_29803 [Cichorium intybus]|uniref:Uncharacterized protein n=1 Tax=Cichorium intybus TaxID=13427 RepID=A0ACB9CYM2_CICIN|nr:hypothetical protein L2E82_29803 [Cichorium intybus]
MATSSFHVDGGGRFDVFFIGTSFLRKALGHRRKGLRIWNNKKKSNTALMGPDVGQKHSRSESNRNHRGSDGFAASLPATARTDQHEIVHAELIDRIDSLRFLFP